MGAALDTTRPGRRGRRFRSGYRPMSEINVTPFVDVMLVLLIVFMIAAPLLAVGVPVELPETEAKPLETGDEPLTVSIRTNGDIYLRDVKLHPDALVAALDAVAEGADKTRIFIRADKAVSYGAIMRVMGRLNGAGFTQLALMTAPEDGAATPEPEAQAAP